MVGAFGAFGLMPSAATVQPQQPPSLWTNPFAWAMAGVTAAGALVGWFWYGAVGAVGGLVLGAGLSVVALLASSAYLFRDGWLR